MIWFREAAAQQARGRLQVALHGCGRCSTILETALNDDGIRARVIDRVDPERINTGTDRSILVLGSDGEDPIATLDAAVRSEAWEAIVFLTESRNPRDAMRALDHGAHDVLSPPHSASAIRLRAEVVRRRFSGWWNRIAHPAVEEVMTFDLRTVKPPCKDGLGLGRSKRTRVRTLRTSGCGKWRCRLPIHPPQGHLGCPSGERGRSRCHGASAPSEAGARHCRAPYHHHGTGNRLSVGAQCVRADVGGFAVGSRWISTEARQVHALTDFGVDNEAVIRHDSTLE